MLKRLVVFGLVFVLLQLGWQAARGTVVQRWVVDDATVHTASALVNILTPAVHSWPQGTAVHAWGGGLNVINGCEGTEAWFLLAAAFVVARLGWRARLMGFALGTLVVFAINQLRILALFYANRGHPDLFDLLHDTVGPIVVIALVAGYFYFWLSRHASQPAAAG